MSDNISSSTRGAGSNDTMEQVKQMFYYVDKILDMRLGCGAIEYRVMWKSGLDDKNNPKVTWESKENLKFCEPLLKEFESVMQKDWLERLMLKLQGGNDKYTDSSPILPKKHKMIADPENSDKVLSATMYNEQLHFWIQLENDTKLLIISAADANVKYPQLVIKFYEEHIVLHKDFNFYIIGGFKEGFTGLVNNDGKVFKTILEYGSVPEKVINVVRVCGLFYFFLKWEHSTETGLVLAEIVYKEYPLMAIKFYEEKFLNQNKS